MSAGLTVLDRMVQVVSIAIVVVAGAIVVALVPYFQAAHQAGGATRAEVARVEVEAVAEAEARPAAEAGLAATVETKDAGPEAAQTLVVRSVATARPQATPEPQAAQPAAQARMTPDFFQTDHAGFVLTESAVLAEPGALPESSTPPALPEETAPPQGLVLTPMSTFVKDYQLGTCIVPYGGMPIPALIQHDYKTPVATLNGREISVWTSGCGADAVSMVVAYLTGERGQTPYTLFRWAAERGLYRGYGLDHEALNQMAALYGVNGRWIAPDPDAILQALNAGRPVIAHMGRGAFTNNGHYIVLRGVAPDGSIYVNDPAKLEHAYLTYPLDQIIKESKTDDPFMICTGPGAAG